MLKQNDDISNWFYNDFVKRKYKFTKSVPKEYREKLKCKYGKITINVFEQLLLWVNQLDRKPKCVVCGNDCKFISIKSGYSKTCKNKHCQAKECQHRREKTMVKKYGVTSNLLKDDNIIKAKNSIIEKYGVDNVFKLESCQKEIQKKIKEKYGGMGAASKVIYEKIQQTNIQKYGYENNFQNPIVQAKSHSLEAKERQKQTCLRKYGVEFTGQAEIKKQHTKETLLDRYGVDHISKCKKFYAKSIETKRMNGTLNSSHQEMQAYEMVKEKYIDAVSQYQSVEYPFNCDIYIPSLDLYIECQFGQFHHKRPYLGTEKDLADVEELAKRSDKIKANTGRTKTRYDEEINTWTIRDVKKRETARKNNLNFIEFWNLTEVDDWLNKQI